MEKLRLSLALDAHAQGGQEPPYLKALQDSLKARGYAAFSGVQPFWCTYFDNEELFMDYVEESKKWVFSRAKAVKHWQEILAPLATLDCALDFGVVFQFGNYGWMTLVVTGPCKEPKISAEGMKVVKDKKP